jgi:pyruvate kinase
MHTGKLTKIVATIGPASESDHLLAELIKNGVNVFRFNTKHNTNEWHLSTILRSKKIAKEMGVPLGILVDLQGPEIRIETLNSEVIDIKAGDKVPFVNDFNQSDSLMWDYEHTDFVRIPEKPVFKALNKGDIFSIDDGFIDFEVIDTYENAFLAEAKDSGLLKTRKGLNLVGKDVDLPSLTNTDKERISMAAEAKADFMGLSFVRTPEDILALRNEMDKHGLKAKVIAKIESQTGVDNLSEILEVADSVMVARGDLGIEVPIERVTHLQKEFIKKCRDHNKPVIVATQMLQSMIENPRPTRAEAADISNAIYDETDAIMLSGETASGKYPIKTVEIMRKIALFNERHKTADTFKPRLDEQTHVIIDAAMAIIAEKQKHKVDKIVVFTETGFSARVLSSFRPRIPIIAISDEISTLGSLTLNYGVWPVKMPLMEADLTYPRTILDNLISLEYIKPGETILIIHGHKYKQPGSTNALVLITA